MRYKHKILFTLLLALPLMIYSGPVLGFSHEEIFVWVANELEITGDYPLPEIAIVSKEELQRIFNKANEQSLKRWPEIYGEEKASQMLDRYLDVVIGIFDPKNNVIYVGNFLEPCEQQSIIAHELVHYFQTIEHGRIDHQSYGAAELMVRNEMEASNIESIFKETFCAPAKDKGSPIEK